MMKCLFGVRDLLKFKRVFPDAFSVGAVRNQYDNNNLNKIQCLYNSTSPAASSGGSGIQRDPLDLSFNDHVASFKSKTFSELLRAYFVYQMCSINYLVDNNMQIMNMMKAAMGEKLFTLLMKQTFYGHFVAGEDRNRIVPCLTRLRQFGVKPILDYSAEEDISQEEAEEREVSASTSEAPRSPDDVAHSPQYQVNKQFADRRFKVQSARTYFYLNEATCEKNTEIFLKCLESVAGATFGTGIMAIKVTALGRPGLLLQLSEVIMQARNYMMGLAGGTGNVLTHHKTIEDMRKYFGDKADSPEVKNFLKNIEADPQGASVRGIPAKPGGSGISPFDKHLQILHLFPWSGIMDENFNLSETFRVPDPKTGQMRRLISRMPPKEEEMFRNMIRRLNTVVQAAKELDVRVMVDAEHTYFQPAISRITLELMRKYNIQKGVVYNTYQTYLKAAYDEVVTDLEQASRQGFYFGAKLVRGAYIELERARAAAMGYEDPICPTYEATTASYHKCLTECLRRIKELKAKNEHQKLAIMVASHNEDTVRFAIEQMKLIGVEPEDKVICFGQLLGMCDYITFPLGQSGYSAYKYIPYGPVHEVLPYLSRRAQENKGVLKKVKKEKRLLRKELLRRIFTGQVFYKPKGNYLPV